LCFCHHKAHEVNIWGLRLLHRADDISVVYAPSTMVASGGVTSAACATVLAWGRGVDSSTAGDWSFSPATALGSSPSQDRSVDFLHSTTSVISQARFESTCTTRRSILLASWTGKQSWLERQVCWRYQ
jgi:hypothetical protein